MYRGNRVVTRDETWRSVRVLATFPPSRSHARGRATGERCLRAQLDQAESDIALLHEELSIEDDRWERSPSRRRTHYTPIQRMRTL